MSIRLISSGSLDAYLEQGNCVLIDIRTPAAYRRSHIAGAVNLPWPVKEQDLRKIRGPEPVIVYCDRGSNSLSVCRALSARGLETMSLVGGFEAYRGTHR